MKIPVTVALVAATAFGQNPTKVDYLEQLKNQPYLTSDNNVKYTTLTEACTAATQAGVILAVGRRWTMDTATIACDLQFVKGGMLAPIVGATVTLTGTLSAPPIQIFDYSAGGTVNLSTAKIASLPPVQWWGAVGDGATTGNERPINWCLTTYAKGCRLPPGTYLTSGQVASTTAFQALECDNRATIQYTGGSAIDAVVKFSGGVHHQKISGCWIVGNGSSAVEFYNFGNSDGDFSDLSAYNTASTGTCFKFEQGNANLITRLFASGILHAPYPCAKGLHMKNEGLNDVVTGVKIEQVNAVGAIGVHLETAFGNQFNGLVSEGNQTCLLVDSGSVKNVFVDSDLEVCPVAGLTVTGAYNTFIGHDTGDFGITTVSGYKNIFQGSAFDALKILNTATFTVIRDSSYGNNGGLFTDLGTCSTIANLDPPGGGAKVPDKVCATSVEYSGNVIVDGNQTISGNSTVTGSQTVGGKPIATTASGTFTPVLNFGGATTGIAYSTQLGDYYTVGDLVLVRIDVALTNKGSATGAATISGLPYTSGSGIGGFAGSISSASNIAVATQALANLPSSSTAVSVSTWNNAGAPTPLTDAQFTNSSGLQITVTYHR